MLNDNQPGDDTKGVYSLGIIRLSFDDDERRTAEESLLSSDLGGAARNSRKVIRGMETNIGVKVSI